MAKRKRKQKNGLQGVDVAMPEICLPTPEFVARHALEHVKTDLGSTTYRVRDKRPIDKYHRLYIIDAERGVGEAYRRGITEEQFRAADRLARNYERSFPKTAMQIDAARVQSSVNVAMYPVESVMHAIHTHTRVMGELGRVSRAIVEEVCCREGSLIDYEQAQGWRKGYGMIRLREACDELSEAFRAFGKASCAPR